MFHVIFHSSRYSECVVINVSLYGIDYVVVAYNIIYKLERPFVAFSPRVEYSAGIIRLTKLLIILNAA